MDYGQIAFFGNNKILFYIIYFIMIYENDIKFYIALLVLQLIIYLTININMRQRVLSLLEKKIVSA
jgi:hypothetical protein